MSRPLALAVALCLTGPAASSQSVPDWARPLAPSAPPSAAFGPPSTPGPTPTQEVPLDGGLGLLALAGGAYAARRLRSR